MNYETGGGNNTFLWAKTADSLKNRGLPSNVPIYANLEHKKVTSETKLRMQEKLYPFLDFIKENNDSLADRSILSFERGEESEKGLLPTTPSIIVTFVKDKNGNIIESNMLLRTSTKYCHFIFRDDEEMQIGETNLDNGYNGGILAWVEGGTSLVHNLIDDKYIVSIRDFMNNPDGSGEMIEIPKQNI